MSLGLEQPASAGPDPERPTIIGGSTRFVPGQSNDRVTIVNGKVQLGQRLKDLWRNRDLLVLLTRTELKVKYKNSVLGYAWSMLNPAMVLGIYYVVFKVIARSQQPHFAIWLFCGLLAWNLFNNSSMSSTTVVVGKAGIIKKVAFPRELLAMSTVGVALVLFTIQLGVLAFFLVVFGLSPDWQPLAPAARVRGADGLHLRRVHLPLGGQRLPAGHPAPDRGTAHGLVLGHADRLSLRPGRPASGRVSTSPGSTSPTR